MTDSPDTMRWVRRGAAIAALAIGWLFIIWQNHFRFTAPTVFVCLGHLALVATVYNLWRTGAAAVDSSEEDDDSTWAKPAGARGELEREKRTLLKAIKEAEFDRDMGKLSRRDADDMIRGYRARAIEVIKEIDLLDQGGAGTVREQILREVRARMQLDDKARARPGKPEPKLKPGARPDAKPEARPDAASAGPAGERAVEPPLAAASVPPEPAAGAPVRPRDEELDADSTTVHEPEHDEPAKEATP
ncbi:MAG TPA: hypothetical protein VHT91_50200 [Kofleriaceae bacterium]|nr:hypothetical protein [Kofleriaceae bacterium]